jgi:alpha-L-rhamnosidase
MFNKNQIAIVFFLLTISAGSSGQHLSMANLKCEYKKNPVGIESSSPSLSWQLKSDQRSVLQTAYRILVANDPSVLSKDSANMWDSKQVFSDQSLHVLYAGKKLEPVKTYFWKVMVWDNKKNLSTWSETGQWQMGLMAKEDWKGAKWIAYDKIADSNIHILPTDELKDTYKGKNVLPLIRKIFTAQKQIGQATVFICGLGQFELSINGKKIGDHFLDPGWTKYDRQALYVPFDITKELQNGTNAIGVMLGNGFYYVPPVPGRYRKLKTTFGYPKMICRLAIDYTDGSHEDVVSDETWKTSPGPVTFSSIYGGEDYDARIEQPNWDRPGFNDASWKNVVLVDGVPILNAQMEEPLKILRSFEPKKISELSPGKIVYDLGQNASGIPEIKVSGNKGDTIRIIPAELLKEDGSANQRATGSPYYLEYIVKGNGIESWQPRFTYYGFRYLQINLLSTPGSTSRPSLIEVKALHTGNAADKIGSFSCSNDLFNRTYNLIDWAIQSNMTSVFTDCPHREKLGWLEQAHLMGNSIRYSYDVINLFRKELQDMKYSQTADGLIPAIAPEYVKFDWGGGMFRDSPEWGSNGIIIPWYLYRWYGERKVLEENYEMMKRYADYLQTKAHGYILSHGLGDWYDLGPNPPGVSQLTPMGITGTAIYYYDLNILKDAAKLLGKKQDASDLENLASKVKQAFNDSFFHKDTKQYGSGSQAANAMAVYMDLVEPQFKDSVIANIVKDLRNRNNSLTAGDIGYRYLLRVLDEAGRSDVIFDMNNRSDVPGYGFQLAKGATSLTESWQALPEVSNNHFMLGHIMEWFYRGLLGIDQTDSAVGYKEILIHPQVVGDVTSAKGGYECMYGMIQSSWEKKKNVFKLKIEIPANTTAVVYLPAGEHFKIKEASSKIDKSDDIKIIGWDKGKLELKLGSGSYSFSVKK